PPRMGEVLKEAPDRSLNVSVVSIAEFYGSLGGKHVADRCSAVFPHAQSALHVVKVHRRLATLAGEAEHQCHATDLCFGPRERFLGESTVGLFGPTLQPRVDADPELFSFWGQTDVVPPNGDLG